MSVDIRKSAARDLTYGNRTVLATLLNWAELNARHAFVYGDAAKTLTTAIGLYDIQGLLLKGSQTVYPIDVYCPEFQGQEIFPTDWKEILAKWFTISSTQTSSWKFKDGDILFIVDVTKQSGYPEAKRLSKLIGQALKNGVKVVIVGSSGEDLPSEFYQHMKKSVGIREDSLNPVSSKIVTQTLVNMNPNRVFVTGFGVRSMTSAIGIADLLARHNPGLSDKEASLRVQVDSESAEALGGFRNLEDLLTQLGLGFTSDLPDDVDLTPSKNRVMITPM